MSPDEVRDRAARMREANPMLGHRGVRLVVASPEIAFMQARPCARGGDPLSVGFFHAAGLNGVSASPWLIPITILAAAQSNLASPRAG